MHFTDPFHVSTRIADKCNDGTLLLQVMYSRLELLFLRLLFYVRCKVIENISFLVGMFFSGHRPELDLDLESKQSLDG